MFARILSFEVKANEKEQFVKTLKDQMVPILKKQIGFLEVLPLFEKRGGQQKVLTISLWTTIHDAERYERDSFPEVLAILKPFATTPVEVSQANLETTLCDRFVDALAV